MSPPFFLFNTLPMVCIYTRLLAIWHYYIVWSFSDISCIEVLVCVSTSYRQ